MPELKKNENDIEPVKTDSEVVDTKIEEFDETKLEEKVEGQLTQMFNEEPAEEPEEPDDSTPEPDKEELEEKSDKDGDTTPEPEDNADEKDKNVESEAKDEDADKGEKEVPQLSDAYYRAAIHRGMKPEEIDEFYEANPKLCVKTLGNIYEAVKRSSEEFAAQGRTEKIRRTQEAAAKATPLDTASEAAKTEYKGVDFVALEKTDIDPDALAIIKTMDQQNKILFDQAQELRETKPVQDQRQTYGHESREARAVAQETAAIQQQIENFFGVDEVKLYGDFYGNLPEKATDWEALSPGQKANRWAVIEMMDDLLAGAHINNRDMSIDEAMQLAHLNISESEREKVIREKLKTNVLKRGKGLSLKPSSTNKVKSASPRTEEELEVTTAERMSKLAW